MDNLSINNIQDLILEIRNEKVLLDSDVAKLYGVETRDINKAVKNNPDKFPNGYVFEITKDELKSLQWKFSTAKLSKTRVLPKSFTEKGLYMLATILRSKQTTLLREVIYLKLQKIIYNTVIPNLFRNLFIIKIKILKQVPYQCVQYDSILENEEFVIPSIAEESI